MVAGGTPAPQYMDHHRIIFTFCRFVLKPPGFSRLDYFAILINEGSSGKSVLFIKWPVRASSK